MGQTGGELDHRLSQPAFEPWLDRDVEIELRDGTRLRADIHRPDDPGIFPAILSMHPYCKDMEDLAHLGSELGGMNVEFAAVEAGDHEFWARRGYAHVIVDVRGTGKSEGRYLNITSPQEAQDGYDVVEWIAEQPWCTGDVGMAGISYLAFVQYMVAAERPPHLRAIFPHDGWADLYRDIMYHGGIPSVFGYVMDQIIPTTEGRPVSRDLYGEEEMRRRAEALKRDVETSVAKNATAYKVLSLPDAHPIAFDISLNRVDGEFYRERSPVETMDRIEVPTYLGSEMHAYPVSMHLPGVSWGWERIPAPKKVAFRPSRQGGLDRPFHELHDEMLRWYDHWLKGNDTGMMDEPPVKIWLRGAEEWVFADEWPLQQGISWRNAYLRGGGGLSWEPPQEAGADIAPDTLAYRPKMPVVINPTPLDEAPPHLSYVSEPFEHEVDVIGPIVARLKASLDGPDGDFLVALKEVDAEGRETVLTRGWLRASHREVDEVLSQPWRPFHPHTDPQPVTPGEVVDLAIAIQPMASRFRPGYRLGFEIWPADHPREDHYDWTQYWGACHHVPFGRPVQYEVHHSPDRASFLTLPVRDA